MDPTLSVHEAKLMGHTTPVIGGALPTAPIDAGETEHVNRRRGPRLGVALVVLLAIVAIGGAALATLWPRAAQRIVDRGKAMIGGAPPAEPARAREPRAERRAVAKAPPPAPEPAPAAKSPDPAPEPPARADPPAPRGHVALVTVHIKTHPSGATVRAGSGGLVGTTPLSLSLRTGTVQHWTFSKAGYSTATRKVRVGPADHVVTVELARARRQGRR
jgi:hypothetical protein